WDAASGEPDFVLRSDAGTVGCVLFTNDDRFLLTGGLDGTIEAWPTDRVRLLELAQRAERRASPVAAPAPATLMRFGNALVDRNREVADRMGQELFARGVAERDEILLNCLAWRLVQGVTADTPGRDLDLALRAAQEAMRLSDGSYRWSVFETLGAVHFARREFAPAVEGMRKAVALCDPPTLRHRLAEYEAALARTK